MFAVERIGRGETAKVVFGTSESLVVRDSTSQQT
jgi:hypothetical protein